MHTKALGEKIELVEFNIDKLRENNAEQLEVTESKANLNAHYTIITLNKLNHKPKSTTITKIFQHEFYL